MSDEVADRWGQFPFGQPNSKRPIRLPKAGVVDALIIGVYPSALHIAWTPTPELDPREADRRRQSFISSLAVDVEPVVFWDGRTPSPTAELDRWKGDVGFEEHFGSASVGNNGPSGTGLLKHFLSQLKIDPNRAAFTDAVPWFFVKKGKRSQGDAIETRFAPIARQLEVHPGSLPDRPSPRELVKLAASEHRRHSLRTEILDADPSLVITLGQEANATIQAIADQVTGVQTKLTPDGYGRAGSMVVDGHRYDLMPLVHPGFKRQTINRDWLIALQKWSDSASAS